MCQVWRPSDGVLCRTLQGHGHWVNSMALSTDYATRIGAWDPALQGNVLPTAFTGLLLVMVYVIHLR